MSDAAISSRVRPGRLRRAGAVLSDVMRRPSGAIGLTLVLLHLAVALLSPWLAPYDYKIMLSDEILVPPSADHWLGTDALGRDVLSRVLLGGRQALLVCGIATPLAILWGGLLGIYLGLRGGWVDDVVMRLVDAVLSLPGILPLMIVVVMFSGGNVVLILTLAVLFGIPVIRVLRAATHGVVARDFVLAARARGHSRANIMWRELLPNVFDVLMVEGAMRLSWMLLSFSALSFLGYGVAPPTPDWGQDVSEARVYMSLAPWGVLGPMIALSSLIVGVNLTADALAKALGLDRAQKAVV
ncbi:MAG: ABC transporter permease [Rhodobacteraceae bacterium]|nr:ABC transporter permease [Paracoccaceae bacterium]